MWVFGSINDWIETYIENKKYKSKWGALKADVPKDADTKRDDTEKKSKKHVETVLCDAGF